MVFGGKIKAVESGNWTIGAIFYPQMIENLTFNASTFSFENISYVHSFFVKKAFLTLSISEDSAEITDYQSGPPFEKVPRYGLHPLGFTEF